MSTLRTGLSFVIASTLLLAACGGEDNLPGSGTGEPETGGIAGHTSFGSAGGHAMSTGGTGATFGTGGSGTGGTFGSGGSGGSGAEPMVTGGTGPGEAGRP